MVLASALCPTLCCVVAFVLAICNWGKHTTRGERSSGSSAGGGGGGARLLHPPLPPSQTNHTHTTPFNTQTKHTHTHTPQHNQNKQLYALYRLHIKNSEVPPNYGVLLQLRALLGLGAGEADALEDEVLSAPTAFSI